METIFFSVPCFFYGFCTGVSQGIHSVRFLIGLAPVLAPFHVSWPTAFYLWVSCVANLWISAELARYIAIREHTDTDAETDTATKMERYKIHRRYIYFSRHTRTADKAPRGWMDGLGGPPPSRCGWLDSLAVLNACQFVVSLSGFARPPLCRQSSGPLVSDCLPRPWNRENRLWPKRWSKSGEIQNIHEI